MNKENNGRVRGTDREEDNEMAQCILKHNGNVVPRFLPRPLQVEEIHSETDQRKHTLFGRLIEGIWGTSVNIPPTSSNTKNETDFEE